MKKGWFVVGIIILFMMLPSVLALCVGDFNNDGFVNSGDIAVFSANFNKVCSPSDSQCLLADLNKDGKVNSGDIAIFSFNFGKSCNKKTIIFQFDDVQADWLENVAVKVVNVHISQGIPITIGVIAQNLKSQESNPNSLTSSLKKWYQNNSNIVEIAQHTYNHCCSYSSWSLFKQTEDMQRAQQEFASFGVYPKTFIPAFDWGNANMLQAALNSGLEVMLDATKNDIIQSPRILDNGTWYLYNFKTLDYSTVSNIVDKSSSSYLIVGSHVQDFQNQATIDKLALLLQQLKDSGKYNFKTAYQYYSSS